MTNVAIVYNQPAVRPLGQDPSVRAGDTFAVGEPDCSETSVVDQVEAIRDALDRSGFTTSTFVVSDAAALVDFLRSARPDAVFNCCESLLGRADLEMPVAGLFELFGVSYTGSPTLTLGLCLNKALAKALLRAHDVPTPRYHVVKSANDLQRAASMRWPVIVKPIAEDASIGIDGQSVVEDAESLSRRVAFLAGDLASPVLVEEYVEGREFAVALLALSAGEWTVLPVEEIDFSGIAAGHPRILTYEAKWLKDSAAYKMTVPMWPKLESDLAARVSGTALHAARVLGLRDYGRVDLRMDSGGRLFVIDVNPNPDLGPDSGFAPATRRAGLTYERVATEIVNRALERRTSAHPVISVSS